MDWEILKEFLDEKYLYYSQARFIANDPVAVPHLFTLKEDIEIAGFLTATIAWGLRKTILKNSRELLKRMDFDPYRFILYASDQDYKPFNRFVHRTFNGTDCVYFLKALRHIYNLPGGMEGLFISSLNAGMTMKSALSEFRKAFFTLPAPNRTFKHLADPGKNASAKRLNMFLRWMVRRDPGGFDFGIWGQIDPGSLYCPLDVHTGRVGRKLGLLNRKANDWKASEELTTSLRRLDPSDPVKYDFALFGLGVYENF